MVSSGTTSKQLNKESDARLIGYGGIIGESLLGLVAILATTAGVINTEAWNLKYATWDSIQGLGPKIAGFVGGCAKFLEVFGFDNYTSRSFISVVVVSYALTSLDSATRLLRYNIEEVVKIKSKNLSALFASLLSVVSIGFFAFYEINGKPEGVALLRLFGTTNQMLAGLALMVVSLYLLVKNLKKKYYLITAIPMSLLLITTLWAMLINMRKFLMQEEYLLFGISAILLGMCIWLIVEGVMAAYRVVYARKKQTSTNMRDTGRWNWQGSSS